MENLRLDLINIRKERGLTQKNLADRIFISQNAISQYERGERQLNFEMFELLLGAMEVEFIYSFKNKNGEVINMTKKNEIPQEPIDFRAIRSEEGFRLWSLQKGAESIVVDVNDNDFIVYERENNDGALFWLSLDRFDRDKLISICKEEGISYEIL